MQSAKWQIRNFQNALASSVFLLIAAFGMKAQSESETRESRGPIRVTKSGPVVGKLISLSDGAVESYLGIPYAEPPVGVLRWKAPEPKKNWKEALDARRPGKVCVQSDNTYSESGDPRSPRKFSGSEDCLSLNVHVPLRNEPGPKKPVMIWIHGGSFVNGAGAAYDGSQLALSGNVVVVTMNYRLGALGFLAHPGLREESGDSGNYALLDQQLAMKWVKDNVSSFGGDEDNITLFGESAGGASVCSQLVSPGAAGLFNKAIIQSGLCSYPGKDLRLQDAEQGGVAFAQQAGCKNESKQIECLRSLSSSKIAEIPSEVVGIEGANSWGTVYESRVLPLKDTDAFASGRFNRVPVLSGSNLDEGNLFISAMATDKAALTQENYIGLVNTRFGAMAGDLILRHYPATDYESPSLAASSILTDAVFSCPAFVTHSLMSKYVKIYAYEFADRDAPLALPIAPGFLRSGAYHAGELTYLFRTKWSLADPAQLSEEQKALSDQMISYWSNFARTGNPNASGLDVWEPFNKASVIQRLAPDAVMQTDNFYGHHKCDFWLTKLN